MKNSFDAVFFISFGGPTKSFEIRPFLENVTRGHQIPQERIEEVAHHYEQIGGASPINEITSRQAQGLATLLKKTGFPLPVYVGNRNWHPFIVESLRQMAKEGVQRAVGFVTAAHRSQASWDRYLQAVKEAQKSIGPDAPEMTYVDPWFDHPLFIEAIVARANKMLEKIPEERRGKTSWIYTAHSIPQKMAQESRYVEELTRTAQLVSEKLGQKKWRLAYQSRSGSPQEAWLEPDVCDVLREQAQKGVQDALIIPIGFVADHVEVLYDLDVKAKEVAQKAGIGFFRAQTVGDHPLFLQMIADLVRETTAKSGNLWPGPLTSLRANSIGGSSQ